MQVRESMRRSLKLAGLLVGALLGTASAQVSPSPISQSAPAPATQPAGNPAFSPRTTGMDTRPLSPTVPADGRPGFPSTELAPGGTPSGGTGQLRVSATQPNVPPSADEITPIVDPVQLTPFITADAIGGAQTALGSLGIYRGPITGTLTGPTRASIRQFQTAVRLPPTGELDLQTARALGLGDIRAPIGGGAQTTTPAGTAQQQVGNLAQGRVLAAQQQLVSLGFLAPSRASGVLDAATRDALLSFQNLAGVLPTGQLDTTTVQLLGEGLVPQAGGVPAATFREDVGPVIELP
jgi:hypothetical protein